MVTSKGQHKAHGHSHGPYGHGGHHSVHEGGVHTKVGSHSSDHMHNPHNKKHAGPNDQIGSMGGTMEQGVS
jgi:hypothetical protein